MLSSRINPSLRLRSAIPISGRSLRFSPRLSQRRSSRHPAHDQPSSIHNASLTGPVTCALSGSSPGVQRAILSGADASSHSPSGDTHADSNRSRRSRLPMLSSSPLSQLKTDHPPPALHAHNRSTPPLSSGPGADTKQTICDPSGTGASSGQFTNGTRQCSSDVNSMQYNPRLCIQNATRSSLLTKPNGSASIE